MYRHNTPSDRLHHIPWRQNAWRTPKRLINTVPYSLRFKCILYSPSSCANKVQSSFTIHETSLESCGKPPKYFMHRSCIVELLKKPFIQAVAFNKNLSNAFNFQFGHRTAKFRGSWRLCSAIRRVTGRKMKKLTANWKRIGRGPLILASTLKFEFAY